MKPASALVALSLLAGAPALAQEAAAPAAPAAQAASDADVNTLNGQLVKVGDAHSYRHSYPRWNVSTNPLGYFLNSFGASLSYAPAANVAVRADASYFDDDLRNGLELGLSAPVYFRKVYSGFFLEPGVTLKALEAEADGASATVVGPQLLLGWHWYWDSRLNVALAAGLGRNWNDSTHEAFRDYSDVFGTAYLRFGYAF